MEKNKINEIDNKVLKENIANAALALLEERPEFQERTCTTVEFGYLFDFKDHGIESLFKVTTDRNIYYFAVQGKKLLELNFNDRLFEETVTNFLQIHLS